MFTLFTVASCIVIVLVFITVHYVHEKVQDKHKPKPTTSITAKEINEKGLKPKYDFANDVRFRAKQVEKHNLGTLKLIDTYSEDGVVKAAFLDNHGVQYILHVGDVIGNKRSRIVGIRKGKVFIETEYVDDYHGFTYIYRSTKKHGQNERRY